MVARGIPEEFERLFWGVDPTAIDLDRHKDFVIERVMSRGSWRAMRWLRSVYATEVLASTLRTIQSRLAPRDVAYWSLVTRAGVAPTPGGARPPWAGP
jgi:hypothetical protein